MVVEAPEPLLGPAMSQTFSALTLDAQSRERLRDAKQLRQAAYLRECADLQDKLVCRPSTTGQSLMENYTGSAAGTYNLILRQNYQSWLSSPALKRRPAIGELGYQDVRVIDVLLQRTLQRDADPCYWLCFVETLSLWKEHFEDQAPQWWDHHDFDGPPLQHLARFVEYVKEINGRRGLSALERVWYLHRPPPDTYLRYSRYTHEWDTWDVDVFLKRLARLTSPWVRGRLRVFQDEDKELRRLDAQHQL